MFKVASPDSSIYAELSVDGVNSKVQEFAAAEERAFVVGSTTAANLRVSAAGAAAVQFHFERDEGSTLEPQSIVEFCGIRMQVRLTESEGLSVSDDRLGIPPPKVEAEAFPYTPDFASEEDVTVVATRPAYGNWDLALFPSRPTAPVPAR